MHQVDGQGSAGGEDADVNDERASSQIYPYRIEVGVIPGSTASFQWTIRKNGKMFQRSDRPFNSEEAARRKAQLMVEKLLSSPE